MPLHTPLIPGFGSKGQNFFSSESGHVVYLLKGDSNPIDKYVLSERALWTMNLDTSIIKIGWKMGKLWAFKEFNMADI